VEILRRTSGVQILKAKPPPPAPFDGGCLVKIRLPIVAPQGFGKSLTFSSSSLSMAWGSGRGPICTL
jgi:hypothetical protein